MARASFGFAVGQETINFLLEVGFVLLHGDLSDFLDKISDGFFEPNTLIGCQIGMFGQAMIEDGFGGVVVAVGPQNVILEGINPMRSIIVTGPQQLEEKFGVMGRMFAATTAMKGGNIIQAIGGGNAANTMMKAVGTHNFGVLTPVQLFHAFDAAGHVDIGVAGATDSSLTIFDPSEASLFISVQLDVGPDHFQ